MKVMNNNLKNKLSFLNDSKGSLLVEIMIAIALLGSLVASSWKLPNVASKIAGETRQETQANALANEYMEMARSRRNEGWTSMFFEDDTAGYLPTGEPDPEYIPPPAVPVVLGDKYHFYFDSITGNLFFVADEVTVDEYGDIDSEGKFTRYITIDQVHRNAASNLITENVADPIDDQTILVTATVEWKYNNKNRSIEKKMYLSNWNGF